MLIKLGLHFHQAATNNAITHVLDFTAQGEMSVQNEQFCKNLHISSMLSPTFGFKNTEQLRWKE